MRNTPGDSARAWPERADLSTLRGGVGARERLGPARRVRRHPVPAQGFGPGVQALALEHRLAAFRGHAICARCDPGCAFRGWRLHCLCPDHRARTVHGTDHRSPAQWRPGAQSLGSGALRRRLQRRRSRTRGPRARADPAREPPRGVVPMGPRRGEGWGGLAVDGVLSRTVRDTAAAIDAVAGIERGAPYAAPGLARRRRAAGGGGGGARGAAIDAGAGIERGAPYAAPALARSLRSAVGDAPRRLRIGVWRAAFAGIDIAPERVEGVGASAGVCGAVGHEVMDGAPPADFDYAGFVEAHTDVLGVNIVLSVDARLQMLGRSLRPTDLEPSIMDGYAQGRSISAARYAAAIHRF